MLKKLLYLSLIVLLFVGCGKKKDENVEEVKQVDPQMYYLLEMPSFSKLFSVLDYLSTEDFDKALVQEDLEPGKDLYISAFMLGRLSADAVIATKSRSKSKLESYAKQMMDASSLLGIHEDILLLSDELNALIKEDKWIELEATLDKYKTNVEANLHEMEDYDTVTLLQLGGWTEGLNRITFLLKDNYKESQTRIIKQEGILNNLIKNLNEMIDPNVQQEPFVKLSVENYKKIKDIIVSSDTYSLQQVEEIFKLTSEIKESVK